MPPDIASVLVGPFVGHLSDSTAKIWMHVPDLQPGETCVITVTLHKDQPNNAVSQAKEVVLSHERLNTGVAVFESLEANAVYFYRLWRDHTSSLPLALPDLAEKDLHFQTLPSNGYDDQLDFLLMSCHNPTVAKDDGADGFAIWARIPDIINANKNVRFALLIGDQIYGDEVEQQVLKEQDARKRQDLYLGVYKSFWSNVHYRKVLCSLPAVLMWDDHDITDGWGSRTDSFTADGKPTFSPEWLRLFGAARSVFAEMQVLRNPERLSSDPNVGFATCFKVGQAGFVLADLRSHRNVRMNRVWLPEQLAAIKKWVNANAADMDTLFFVSSVVFSHGDPPLDNYAVKNWPWVMRICAWLLRWRLKWIKEALKKFDDRIGDISDDLNDSWGSEPNRGQADEVLDFLFGVQNGTEFGKEINVVILSGDIHTPGYSNIYSNDSKHRRAVIPHIVASPVAYEPFSWMLEALYRHLTSAVRIGAKDTYTAQVSHHYCHRNVVVVSLRHFEKTESQLKVKFYLEGFPEPQILLFDLNRGSHREAIPWPESTKKVVSPFAV